MTHGVGVQLLAAYLGVPEWRIRRLIAKHHIQPLYLSWKQHMYDPQTVIRHARADGIADKAISV